VINNDARIKHGQIKENKIEQHAKSPLAGIPKTYWAVYKNSNGQYTKTSVGNIPKSH
jgi:hypothetical protein